MSLHSITIEEIYNIAIRTMVVNGRSFDPDEITRGVDTCIADYLADRFTIDGYDPSQKKITREKSNAELQEYFLKTEQEAKELRTAKGQREYGGPGIF